jgi:branched-chain amino acid transport system ATP-binding protein
MQMATLNKAVMVEAVAWDTMLPAAFRKAAPEKTAAFSYDATIPATAEGARTILHQPVPAQTFMFEAQRVSLRFDGVHALTDVSCSVREGELFSIVGPNGAGKTSMLNCISGRYRLTEGQLVYRGRDISRLKPNARAALGIGRTFQNLALFHHMTVLDNIMVGRHHLLANNFLTGSLYWLTGARREELAHRRKVEEIIDFLELQPVREAVAGTLSYGLRKRVELARAMAMEPRLLLLDEPMAGMNLEEKEDMARYIVDLNEEFGMTVIMIEHDMSVVADISHRVMVLDFGRKIAEGRPTDVLAKAQVEEAYLGKGRAFAPDQDRLRVVGGIAP